MPPPLQHCVRTFPAPLHSRANGLSANAQMLIPLAMLFPLLLRAVSFPPAFGEPPRMQTRDLRTLPFGYGMGSGTIAAWLTQKAEEVYRETVDEYSQIE